MKRLTRILLRLYPAAWRSRYRDELEALIEDSGSSWRAIPDLLKEAVRMQFTTWSFGKLAVVLALAGLIASALTSAFIPATYVSSAELHIAPSPASKGLSPLAVQVEAYRRLAQMQNEILSRTSLAGIIQDPRLDLYESERESTPLEDVIEKMRREDIRVSLDAPSTFAISFRYPDKLKAQQTTMLLMRKFQDANVSFERSCAGVCDYGLQVIDPPTFPARPRIPYLPGHDLYEDLIPAWFKPAWLAMALAALIAGNASRFFKPWPFGRKTAIAGIAGLAAAALIFPLIPSEYVSRTELQIVSVDDPANPDPEGVNREMTGRIDRMKNEILSRSNLAGIIQHPYLDLYKSDRKSTPLDEVIQKMRQHINVAIVSVRGSPSAFMISFRYPDRTKGQQTLQAIVGQLIQSERREEAVLKSPPPPALRAGFDLDVLKSPEPASPANPNRWLFALIGVAAGIMLAALARLFLKLRTAMAA